MIFDRKGFQALSEEIQLKKEDLSLQVVIFGATVSADGDALKESVIGIAIVNLWYMIEDSCGIIMQVTLLFYFIMYVLNVQLFLTLVIYYVL
jgi:hypothetical protein